MVRTEPARGDDSLRPETQHSSKKTPLGAPPARESFRCRAQLEIHVEDYVRVALSAPALDESSRSLRSKDLLSAGAATFEDRFTIEQHLKYLVAHGSIDAQNPLLVMGARNCLVNERAIVISRGVAAAVEGEDPLQSVRPYYGLGRKGGRLVADVALGGVTAVSDWPDFFISGIPVAWDGLQDRTLFDAILTETADHSHVFALPRGNHPAASDDTREAWRSLHQVFLSHIHADAAAAAAAMRGAVDALPNRPVRERDYLHQVLSVDEHGRLLCLVAHGMLEDLGRTAIARGYSRALCVENSGSIMPTFYPRGPYEAGIPLFRAPNYRRRGRTMLAIELQTASFATLPSPI